jgi:hypothetical protein
MPARNAVIPPALKLIAMLIILGLAALPAQAGDVSVEIQSRDVFINVPFTITLSLENAESYDPVSLPDVEGLTRIGEPQRSERSFTQIINGRRTDSRTVQYSFVLVATTEGKLVIPEFSLTVDGVDRVIRPIVLTVSDSSNDDLMRARITAERESVHLGEPVDLTLTVWIRQYIDRDLNVSLGANDMWSLVDLNRSAWGAFLESIRGGDGQAGARVAGRQVTLTDQLGESATFFEYTVRAVIRPDSAGPLALDPVAVLMRYPTRLEHSRDFFSRGQLTVGAARPVVAPAETPDIAIRPLPDAGRSPLFAGAVGRFAIDVAATPTEVTVGEPVTLTMTITDRTPRATRLELLQATPLDRIDALNEAFNVPDESLAGVVDGRTKTFTQSIRAKRDDVTEIPPIPFVYFDPAQERYVTVTSDPIPISVSPSATVGAADVIGGAAPSESETIELTERTGGLRANAAGSEVFAADAPFRPQWTHLALLLLPPGAWLVLTGARWGAMRRRDEHQMRKRRAAKRAARRFAHVARMKPAEQASAVSRALADYIADRCGLPDGALTPTEAVRHAADRSVAADTVASLASLFTECDHAQFAGSTNAESTSLADRARRAVRALERESFG